MQQMISQQKVLRGPCTLFLTELPYYLIITKITHYIPESPVTACLDVLFTYF